MEMLLISITVVFSGLGLSVAIWSLFFHRSKASNKDNHLLPCPFCGSKNLIKDAFDDESAIRCQNCGCDGPTSDYKSLDEIWNKRA